MTKSDKSWNEAVYKYKKNATLLLQGVDKM